MYLDSAIIVKLLLEESDSTYYKEAITGEITSTNDLALTEVWSALLSKERGKHITTNERKNAWKEFTSWVEKGGMSVHSLDEVVLNRARLTLERCHPDVPLRTLDAIHVASCDLSQDYPLCTNDKRMRDAATLLKIPIFPE